MSVEQYVDTWLELEKELSRTGPVWLQKLRMSGLEMFRTRGFPTLRDELWKHTRVRPIAGATFTLADGNKSGELTEERIVDQTFDDSECRRLVFADGFFVPGLSRVGELQEGVLMGSLATALADHPDVLEPFLGRQANIEMHTFAALNTAFIRDGALVFLQRNIDVDKPIHIVHASTGDGEATVSHPRTLVVAGDNSRVTVVESFIGGREEPGTYFTNSVSEFFCGDNAEIRHRKLQCESPYAYHVAAQQARIDRNGRFNTVNISIGGSLVRNDCDSVLDGEGIDCRVDGLYLATRRQHVDNHTFIRHAKPNCHSFEKYRGILDGKARGVFNGKIYVDPDAQKTDAKQSNNCILLSEDARINTNPQLEIFADDVKCTHGATVGQLDEDAVFYLRSRGIPDERARHILIYAFAAELFELVKFDRIRDRLENGLYDWLASTPSI